MGYRRFGLSVSIQVALILVSCGVIAYLAAVMGYLATALLVLAILALQVAGLIHYVTRTNRELARFMLAIRHQDLSQSFTAPNASGAFNELAAAFEEILQRLRDTRSAKEEQANYLHTLVQHVPVAVIAIDETGRVDLFNNAARRLFGVSGLKNLHEFEGFGHGFVEKLRALQTGQRQLIKVVRDDGLMQLNAMATELRIAGHNLKIISLQDIHGELEAREIEAWQNLIRVLTHEIMNSVTPISSLAATAAELLAEARDSGASDGNIEDVEDAVDTIAKRSEGLLHFVESYRRLTRLPKPAARLLNVSELFDRIVQLMGPEFKRRGIEVRQSVEPQTLEIHADPDLLEQALINLIRNAIDAVAGVSQPCIRMTAELDPNGRPLLSVEDNGHGMDEHVRENIFVPFFTTKRHGSGVGMNLVRQIMRSHHGQVGVRSAPGAGTAIRLSF